MILIRKYGSGEPTDEMVESIKKDVTKPYKRVVAIGGGTVIDVAKLFCLEKFTSDIEKIIYCYIIVVKIY